MVSLVSTIQKHSENKIKKKIISMTQTAPEMQEVERKKRRTNSSLYLQAKCREDNDEFDSESVSDDTNDELKSLS